MFKNKALIIFTVILTSLSLTGFGVPDVGKDLDVKEKKCKGSKCDKDRKADKELVKKVVTVVAVGLAAKLIADMVINAKSKKVADADVVTKEYLKTHKNLPEKPEVVKYVSNLEPGALTNPGKSVTINSSVSIVAGEKVKTVKLEERLEIYDNEDHSKMISSKVKEVNKPKNAPGIYQNEFTFDLHEKMPQGVYPIKTVLLVDGKEVETKAQKMQIVMTDVIKGSYEVAFLD